MVTAHESAPSDLKIGSLRVWVDAEGALHGAIADDEFGADEWSARWSMMDCGGSRPSITRPVEFEGTPAVEHYVLAENEQGVPMVIYRHPARNARGRRGTNEGSVVFHGWDGKGGKGFHRVPALFVPESRIGKVIEDYGPLITIAALVLIFVSVLYFGRR